MKVSLVVCTVLTALAGALADRFIEDRATDLVTAEREAVVQADEELLAKVDAIAEQVEDLRAALRARTN